jgi:hypothetical protein
VNLGLSEAEHDTQCRVEIEGVVPLIVILFDLRKIVMPLPGVTILLWCHPCTDNHDGQYFAYGLRQLAGLYLL